MNVVSQVSATFRTQVAIVALKMTLPGCDKSSCGEQGRCGGAHSQWVATKLRILSDFLSVILGITCFGRSPFSLSVDQLFVFFF